MVTITVRSKCYGNSSQYIARITGRDSKFGYRREFIGRKNGQESTAYVDEPQIVEDCDIDKKGRKESGYWLIITRPASMPPKDETGDPSLIKFRASESDVMAITKRLDKGESLEDIVEATTESKPAPEEGVKYTYRLRTPGEAKKASAAATIDQAVEQCWQILGGFREKEAKAVLAVLKLRVSPKPPASLSVQTEVQPEQPVEVAL